MDLVEVTFAVAGKTVLVQPGTTLLAAADLVGAGVMAGCTRGMCGTDAVRVAVDPADALEPPAAHEAGTLARMGLDAGCRLACQTRVRCGRIAVLGDALA
jgi:ferredoxin